MKQITVLVLFLLVAAGGFYFLSNNPQLQNLKESNLNLQNPQELLEEIGNIVSPPPLRSEINAPSSFLTAHGVVKYTNIQRVNQGLVALQANELLSVAAAAKVQDMFQQQYFAHTSPIGQSAGDLATLAGYEYIAIGENLALGNFENDEKLVEAWMNSPGHRANILNTKYQEIGVAVGKGMFEGRTTWLAVQIFGKPLASCPHPSVSLKTQIENLEQNLNVLEQDILTLREEIDAMKPKRGEEYNQKVDVYNSLVEQYNNLIEETKKLVSQYNQHVQAFNACVSQ